MCCTVPKYITAHGEFYQFIAGKSVAIRLMYNYNYNLRQQEQICIAVKSISLPVTTLEPEDWAPLTDIFSADALLSSPIMGEVNWPRNPDLISLS